MNGSSIERGNRWSVGLYRDAGRSEVDRLVHETV
jgi:hypothetical protein